MQLYQETLAVEASGMLEQAPCFVVVATVLSEESSAELSSVEAQLRLCTKETGLAMLDLRIRQSVLQFLCHAAQPHGDSRSNFGLVPASLGYSRTAPM